MFSPKSLLLAAAVALVSLAPTASAAISPGGIVDGASFRSSDYPSAGIAQRSIFNVFGTDLADAGLVTATSFPLQTTMGGTSIQVTVGGTTVDCLMIFTTPGQVAALLPSNTPVGTGTLTLRHGGQTFTEPITVVAHYPSIFSQNSQGSGPASLTNFVSDTDQPLNQLDKALTPGQFGIVWLTGLGAAAGNDAGPPTADDLRGRYDIKVYVGGQLAELVYAGPSGCCSGVDQIVFKPAAGIVGCYVPVVVVVNGVASNYTSVSIAQSGEVCSEPGLLDSSALTSALSGGDVRLGLVSFSSVDFQGPDINVPLQGFGGTSEFASANFEQFSSSAFRSRAGDQAFLTRNSCMVFTFSGDTAVFNETVASTGLQAGTVTLQGPFGSRTLNNTAPGDYSLALSQPGIPGLPGGVLQSAPILTPGTYTYAASGGSGVGAFSTSRTYSGGLTWTNKDSINDIPRGQGLTVTWSGGDAGEEDAWIFGSSFAGVDLSALSEEGALQNANEGYGAAFFCQADLSRGSFTIGPEVLSALPPSLSINTQFGSFGTGSLQVGSSSKPREFSAPMLDLGFFVYQKMTAKTVDYQ